MKKYLLITLVLVVTILSTLISAQADMQEASPVKQDKLSVATFAGGCFWCTESDFEKLDGVASVISGYSGGQRMNPSYAEVSSGTTKHLESVEVHYDPTIIGYAELLNAFWKMINPTDDGGQFVDRGYQYTTAIFYHTVEQKMIAEQSKRTLNKSGRYPKEIVTPIRKAGPFYAAEDYHQDYYKRNPIRYNFYRWNSGRDQYLAKIWGENEMQK